VELPVLAKAAHFFQLAASSHGYVAFGTDADCWSPFYCGDPAAYFSADGRVWQAVVVDDRVFRNARINAVIDYEGGLIAAGLIFRMPSGDKEEPAEAGVWTSTDGLSWTKATFAQADVGQVWNVCQGSGVFAGGIGSVAAVGDVVVGLGSHMARRGSCGYSEEPRLWRSLNGTDWERSQLPRDYRRSVHLVVGGVRFLLAADDRVWTSPDGNDWTAVDLPVATGSYIWGIIEHDLGYLAYAVDKQGQWHAFASGDGIGWTDIGQPNIDVWRCDIVATGDVLVTLFGTSDSGLAAGIATSRDGVQWSAPQIDVFDGFSLERIATDGRSVVVTGFDDQRGEPAMWIADID
jgi:hypothetical protein